MDLNNGVKRYALLIPEWLSKHVSSKEIPLTDLVKLEQLAHKVSVEDVCFYVAYNTNRTTYIGDLMEDFVSFLQVPENVAWLSKHESQVKAAAAQFDIAVRRVLNDGAELSDSSAPVTVRKTSYVPVSLDDMTIAYIGEGSNLQFDRFRFCEQCIVELNKMMSYTEIRKLKVFETFCVAPIPM